LCVPRREESFQPPDEGFKNLPKVGKCHGFKPRSTTRRKKHESGIPNATNRKTAGVKSIYISNDPASTKVEERAKDHIQTSQLGNIITTNDYRIPAVVRSTSRFSRADHPREVPRPGHAPIVLKAQIGGYDIGRVFMDAGSGINLIYARTLKAMCISIESLKPTDYSFHGIVPGGANYPLRKIELDVCFGNNRN
jgi:hypothetical protein